MNLGSLKAFCASHRAFLVGASLALVTLVVYGQVLSFEFTNYDDPFMIVENPFVRSGLTWAGLRWALTTSYFEYWHPLTWLSHMLDCQLFGMNAGLHHLQSLGLHVANTCLVFVVFYRMTAKLTRSAVVAALFSLHPMHVESVAWVAERKDVLGAFFFLLSMWFYVRHVQKVLPASELRRATSGFYWLALFFFALGLMSKPMVVTLPFVLLLLDFWPLQRFNFQELRFTIGRLLLEKAPFFGLMLGSCVITIFGVKTGDFVVPTETFPLGMRLAHVPVAYARYLGKLIWPVDLTAFYPRPGVLNFPEVAMTVLVVLAISVIVLMRSRRSPHLVFGWLMFLGTLVPTIGIVAVGYQAIADRYTYIPYIGLFVSLVWMVAEISARWPSRSALLGGVTGATLLACGVLTRFQVQHWRNSTALWTHALAVNSFNDIAHLNLGCTLLHDGRLSEAEEQFRETLRIAPAFSDAHINLGAALAAGGRLQKATNCFAAALRIKPRSVKAHEHLGRALLDLGDFSGAAAHFDEAIRLAPDNADALAGQARILSSRGKFDEAVRFYSEALRRNPFSTQAHYQLGLDWLKRGNLDEAIAQFNEVLRIDRTSADAHFQLAVVFARQHRITEAVAHYREALRLKPNSSVLLNNVAWILATHPSAEFRDGVEAVKLAERACELSDYKQTIFIGTLAAAYAEAGQFDKAGEASRMACDLASALGQTNLLRRNQELLQQFQNRTPFHEQQ